MKQNLLGLIIALLWTAHASAAADYKKYIPDFAQQYIREDNEDKNSPSSQKESTDFKKYIPEPYQKYIPDFINGMENMEDLSWDTWEEESPSSPLQSSLADKILHGPSSLSNSSYNNLTGHGPLKLTHVTITKNLLVNGPLTGIKIQAASMEVSGPVKVMNLNVGKAVIRGIAILKEAHVKNDLTVYGPLLAQKSTFKGPLRLFTSEMRLKDCQAHSIIIEKDKTYFVDSPRVHLVGETKVFGNIEFKGKKGIVEVGPEVKIEGKIINGTIQDKKK